MVKIKVNDLGNCEWEFKLANLIATSPKDFAFALGMLALFKTNSSSFGLIQKTTSPPRGEILLAVNKGFKI
jgi:hypothetical protein